MVAIEVRLLKGWLSFDGFENPIDRPLIVSLFQVIQPQCAAPDGSGFSGSHRFGHLSQRKPAIKRSKK
jgi:hypothetical protein